MSFYSNLLNKAIEAIQGHESKAQQSIFDFSGYQNDFANTSSDVLS